MIIRFDKDLTKQDIFANGDELAQIMGRDRDENGNRVYTYPEDEEVYVTTIRNPVLMTDNYKIGQLEPDTLRDTIFALYAGPVKIIEYDNTGLRFEQNKYDGTWGPSIDTLLFCRGLNQIDLTGVLSAIDSGSGSGLIAKDVLGKAPNLESITLIDLNKYSTLCAQDNIDDPRATFVTGDAIEYLDGKQYDMILCNPPYILRQDSINDNPYEGLELFHHVVANARNNLNDGGRIITNISSLSSVEAYKFIEEAGLKARVIDSMHVPLKIYNLLNNEEWLNYLLDTGCLKQEKIEGYTYWHKIVITEITV